jgi:hypothetical protein
MGYLGGLEAIWLRDAKDLASMAEKMRASVRKGGAKYCSGDDKE